MILYKENKNKNKGNKLYKEKENKENMNYKEKENMN